MKKYIELDRITDDISTRMASGKELTQDLIFCFMKKFIADNGSFFDAVKTKSYKVMKSMLNELWQYREWKDMSPEQAFLCGQLYGCVKLCEYREQSRQDTVFINFLLSKYGNSKPFRIIKENPGIRHKDLARKINISPGRLSQIMDDEDMQELFASRVLGREKHYFLGVKGEELLRKLEEQERKANREQMQRAKLEKESACLISNMWKKMVTENANTNTLPSFDIFKVNPAFQYNLEKSSKNVHFDNLQRTEMSIEEEVECLMEENSYYGQSTNLLRNGSMMSSAR